jgi:hypothetical protein
MKPITSEGGTVLLGGDFVKNLPFLFGIGIGISIGSISISISIGVGIGICIGIQFVSVFVSVSVSLSLIIFFPILIRNPYLHQLLESQVSDDGSGQNVIKLFASVIFEIISNKLECLSLANLSSLV